MADDINAAGGVGTEQYGPTNSAPSTGGAASGGNYGAMGMTAIGGLTSAYATYMAGRANKRIAQFNANYAKQQAQQALEAGRFAANRVEIKAQQTQGADRAAEAGAGIIAGAGTSAAVEASNAAASNMDALMIKLNAQREAYGFQVKAAGDTMQGEMAQRTGEMEAGATLLRTGSQEWLESDPAYGGLHGSGLNFGGR